MKKFHSSIAISLAATIVLSSLCMSGCKKSDETSLITSSASSSTSEPCREETTTSDASETTTVGSTGSSTNESSEPSQTTMPDNGSSSGVKAHWDNYRPVASKKPDPIMNWIDEDHPSDFVPSSDYGRIYFYKETINGTYIPSFSAGCIDANGRVICKPFVNSFEEDKDGNGYILTKNVSTDAVEHNRSLTYRKVGFLSLDGSFYTGLIYDDYYFDDEGRMHFVRYTSDGLKTVSYDTKTGLTGDPVELRFDFTKIPDHMTLGKVVLDRYIVFEPNEYIDSDDPYEENETILFDGQTGMEIITSNHQFIVGNTLLLEEQIGDGNHWDNDTMFTCTLTDHSGNQLWQKTYYQKYIVSDDRILFQTNEGYELLDLSGNLIGALKKDDEYLGGSIDRPYIEVQDANIFLYVYFPSADDTYTINKNFIFDKDLHLIESSTSTNQTLGFDHLQLEKNYDYAKLTNTVTGQSVVFYGNTETYSSPDYVIVRTDADDPLVYEDDYMYAFEYHFLDPNDLTEKKVLKGRLDNNYNLSQGFIIMQNRGSFQLIDAKDLHVIKEIEGWVELLQDFESNNTILYVFKRGTGDDYFNLKYSDLLDPSTGSSILSKPLPEEYSSLIQGTLSIDLSNKRFFYHGENCNILFNDKSEILFLSYVYRTQDQEHYWDDSFYYDEEPDSP